jgi:hypothetical protein
MDTLPLSPDELLTTTRTVRRRPASRPPRGPVEDVPHLDTGDPPAG